MSTDGPSDDLETRILSILTSTRKSLIVSYFLLLKEVDLRERGIKGQVKVEELLRRKLQTLS